MTSEWTQKTKRKITGIRQRRLLAKTALETARSKKKVAKQHVADAERAVAVIQTAASQIQTKAHEEIAGIVTRCLHAVFEDPYDFKILFESKRNRTEARIAFMRNGEEYSPMDSTGGGVIDIAAFALRIAALVLSMPQRDRVLILDEPFRFVSKQYRPMVRDLLETLAKEMGIQFVIVTHITELECGNVIEIY